MSSIVNAINAFLGEVIQVLLYPFRGLDPVWGLVCVSAVLGVVLLLIYGKVSNQQGIRKVKRNIYANMLEAVLFRHDIRTSLKAQGRLCIAGARYFLYAVPPLIVLMVPVLLVLGQLQLYYAERPFTPGEKGILSVKVSDPALLKEISLEVPASVKVTPPIRVSEDNEVSWRIESTTAGDYPVSISVPSKNQKIEEVIRSGEDRGPIAGKSFAGWFSMLLYPSAINLASQAPSIQEIVLEYPERHLRIMGMQLHWLLIFFIVSLVSGLIASKFLKVEI